MVSCGGALIKYLLFFFNLVWLALGGVILWLGFKISSFSGSVNDIIEVNMKAGTIVILAAGFIIFLIAFLGCCGAIKENGCMLNTYAGIILILVIIQCVGAYFAFKYKTDIKDTLKKGIEEQVAKFGSGEEYNKVVQNFQKEFECCGAEGPDGYKGKVPASCCGQDFSKNASALCSADAKVIFHDGCVDKIFDKVNSSLGGLGGVAIGLVLVQLLIIISACCLSREVR